MGLLLPSDCIKIILDYTDIQDASNVCLGLSNSEDSLLLLKERCSPIRLFSGIVNNPRDLLYHMSVNRCVLSGSRAANYMYPGSCSEDSDWDFYIEQDLDSKDFSSGSMKQSFEQMGVIWTNRNSRYQGMMLKVLDGVTTQGTRKGSRIQLVSSVGKSTLHSILSFHTTATQCMVTHYGAFHMYAGLSRQRKQVVQHKSISLHRQLVDAHNARECRVHRSIGLLQSPDPENIDRFVSSVKRLRSEYLLSTGIERLRTLEDIEDFQRSVQDKLLAVEQRPSVESILEIVPYAVAIACFKCLCIEDKSTETIEKYTSRGYSIQQSKSDTTGSPVESQVDKLLRTRSAADSDSLVLSFKGYNLYSSNRHIDIQIKQLLSLEWYEYDGYATLWDYHTEVSEENQTSDYESLLL